MSWLAKSFANLIAVDDDESDDETDDAKNLESNPESEKSSSSPTESNLGEENPGKGVKEDISELSQALTRQLWGVASFLAPPPSSSSSDPDSIGGIRSDFAEIGGKFRSGISVLAGTKAVSEISKIASSFLQLGEEEELESGVESGGIGAIGVTEEVLSFAENISLHPETWLDFPLFFEEELPDAAPDFDMSDAQQEHALAVERLVPRLAALRIELCPGHISEGTFWKIYFVLLHPRLNKHDAELLSTPQIVEARALLLQDLQSRTRSSPDNWSSVPAKAPEPPSYQEDESVADVETEKHPVAMTEVRIIDKAVIEDVPLVKVEKAEEPKITAVIAAAVDDEDVSFSDLEEDDEIRPGAPPASSSGAKLAPEVNDWSDLDDFDVA